MVFRLFGGRQLNNQYASKLACPFDGKPLFELGYDFLNDILTDLAVARISNNEPEARVLSQLFFFSGGQLER